MLNFAMNGWWKQGEFQTHDFSTKLVTCHILSVRPWGAETFHTDTPHFGSHTFESHNDLPSGIPAVSESQVLDLGRWHAAWPGLLSIQPHGGRLRTPACTAQRGLEIALIGCFALKHQLLAHKMETMVDIQDLMIRSEARKAGLCIPPKATDGSHACSVVVQVQPGGTACSSDFLSVTHGSTAAELGMNPKHTDSRLQI